jgi:hypothetical protein
MENLTGCADYDTQGPQSQYPPLKVAHVIAITRSRLQNAAKVTGPAWQQKRASEKFTAGWSGLGFPKLREQLEVIRALEVFSSLFGSI